VDLFGKISDRNEMMDQLGMNGVALSRLAWGFGIVLGLMDVLLAAAELPVGTYALILLGYAGFMLLYVLMLETGNSLVNPVEGLVLAHQPIDGATYTAAKLTHLARIVVFLGLGTSVAPAVAGLMLKDAGWSYPLLHLAAALAIGGVEVFLCCAVYGWLMRLVPAQRLKAAAQLFNDSTFCRAHGTRARTAMASALQRSRLAAGRKRN
jgi:hypothetical protein